MSGCSQSDDECLANVPSILGATSVIFGNVHNADGTVSVHLVTTRTGEPVARETIVLVGATSEERVRRYRFDLSRALTGEDPATATLPTDTETSGASEANELPTLGPVDSGSETSWSRSEVGTSAWIVAGVGVTSTVAGGVFLLLGKTKQSEVDDAPVRDQDDLEELESLESQARTRFALGNVLTIGGLVTTAVGAVLIFRQGRVSVSPQIEADGGSVAVTISGW